MRVVKEHVFIPASLVLKSSTRPALLRFEIMVREVVRKRILVVKMKLEIRLYRNLNLIKEAVCSCTQ